jgi:hypothetical protein
MLTNSNSAFAFKILPVSPYISKILENQVSGLRCQESQKQNPSHTSPHAVVTGGGPCCPLKPKPGLNGPPIHTATGFIPNWKKHGKARIRCRISGLKVSGRAKTKNHAAPLSRGTSAHKSVRATRAVMPEHFHLLISEPEIADPSVMMKGVKQRLARQLRVDPTQSHRTRLNGASGR